MADEADTVLLVEDDEAIRTCLAETLNELGYVVFQAVDGEAARSMLKEGREFSLLVTDLWMPRLSGTELLAWCRDEAFGIPTIVMSADTQLLAQISRTHGTPCAMLLRKPFDLTALVKCLDSAAAGCDGRGASP